MIAESASSPSHSPEEGKVRRRSQSSMERWEERRANPVYEHRYFKDERGRSVQLRCLVASSVEEAREPIPSESSSYTTFDNSRLTYARSAGLPSLGKKYAPGQR